MSAMSLSKNPRMIPDGELSSSMLKKSRINDLYLPVLSSLIHERTYCGSSSSSSLYLDKVILSLSNSKALAIDSLLPVSIVSLSLNR